MYGTFEQRRILRWLENREDTAERVVRVEPVTKNAMRVVDRAGEATMVICRQDGTMRVLPCDEPA